MVNSDTGTIDDEPELPPPEPPLGQLQSTHLGDIPPHYIGLSPIQPTLTNKLKKLPKWTGENAQYRDQQHAFGENGLTRSKYLINAHLHKIPLIAHGMYL